MPNLSFKLNVLRTLIVVALFAFSAFASNAQGVRGVVTDPAGRMRMDYITSRNLLPVPLFSDSLV